MTAVFFIMVLCGGGATAFLFVFFQLCVATTELKSPTLRADVAFGAVIVFLLAVACLVGACLFGWRLFDNA